MPQDTSLLAELRRRIRDNNRAVRALSLALSDPTATSATAEITGGRLRIDVASGTTPSVDIKLSDSRYDTIGRLAQALSRTPGYAVQFAQDGHEGHPSVDLLPFGPLEIAGTGVTLTHHLFSDSELREILEEAIRRHNPSLTISTLPIQEHAFVLPLAQAGVCRIQAYDASKRRGLDADVSSLLQLANSFEEQYRTDRERLAKAIRSPKEANPNLMDEGDVVLGLFTRRSLRNGYTAPIAGTLDPSDVILIEPDEHHDTEDDNVRVRWERNKDYQFYSYELWMDTRPDVFRSREGAQAFAGTPIAYRTTEDTIRAPAVRQTTSQMVFRSLGANSNSARSSFSTFVEEFGQLLRMFSVSELEPETTYYFRLYVVNQNYTATGSNIVKATTKPLRCRFLRLTPNKLNPSAPYGPALSSLRASPGTVITVTCDSSKGQFTANHKFKLESKEITPTILTPYSFSFTVPAFQNVGLKQLIIIGPNGLVDVYPTRFEVLP